MVLQLTNLFQFAKLRSTNPASFLCELNHYYIRNFFVFGFSISITKQFFGDVILCNTYGYQISNDIITTTCYSNGTFTNYTNDKILYHNYYQWILIILILEAFSFYLPYHVWLHWARVVPYGDRVDYQYIVQQILKFGGKYRLFWKNFTLEIIYAIHVIVQAILINFFLNGYIFNGVAIDNIFPFNGKCHVNYYQGGFETTGKFHCILPLNVVYRLLFKIMYFGFWILLGMHILTILYRIIQYCIPVFRFGGLKSKDINIWWIYSMIENNTQGENLWKLKSVAQSLTLSKDTEIPLMDVI